MDNVNIRFLGEWLSAEEIGKKVDAVIAPESGEFDIYQLVAMAAEVERLAKVIEDVVIQKDKLGEALTSKTGTGYAG